MVSCVFCLLTWDRIRTIAWAVGLALALFAVPWPAAQLQFQLLAEDVIDARLRNLAGSDFEREATLRKLFAESGCNPEGLSEQRVASKSPPNPICTLPGAGDEVIWVGAHFDHVDPEPGSGGQLERCIVATQPAVPCASETAAT
jgi:hypothetical protein